MGQLQIFSLKFYFFICEWWWSEIMPPPKTARKKAWLAGRLMQILLDLHDLDPKAHETIEPQWIRFALADLIQNL